MRETNSCVLGANATWRASDRPSRRATCPCARGSTSPSTRSHLRSRSAAESSQYAAWAAWVASGQGWWLCAAKCSRPGSAWRLREKCSASIGAFEALVPVGLDVDAQQHVVGERGDGVLDAPVAALDVGDELAAAHRLLVHRVVAAIEVLDIEGHRLRDPLHREVALHRLEPLALEIELASLEGDGGVRRRMEEVLGADVLLELVQAGVDRHGIDAHLDGAGTRITIDGDLAAGLVEAAALQRHAEVAHLERGKGVAAVDGVGLDSGGRGQGGREGGEGDDCDAFHGSL